MRLRSTLIMLGSQTGLAAMLSSCRIADSTGWAAIANQSVLDLSLCAPGQGGFSATSTNPYFPFKSGSQWIYDGSEAGVAVHLEITALEEFEDVGGVTTRVIEERETHDGVSSEVSRNFFVQTSDGTVCYYGEAVDIFNPDGSTTHEGSWRGDDLGNAPGIIMPANPKPGMKFQFESAPGIAEDEGTIVGTGPMEVLGSDVKETIRIREFNPLDGGKDSKIYAAGFGLVTDGTLTLTSYTP